VKSLICDDTQLLQENSFFLVLIFQRFIANFILIEATQSVFLYDNLKSQVFLAAVAA
jgi:hypothetical protein